MSFKVAVLSPTLLGLPTVHLCLERSGILLSAPCFMYDSSSTYGGPCLFPLLLFIFTEPDQVSWASMHWWLQWMGLLLAMQNNYWFCETEWSNEWYLSYGHKAHPYMIKHTEVVEKYLPHLKWVVEKVWWNYLLFLQDSKSTSGLWKKTRLEMCV